MRVPVQGLNFLLLQGKEHRVRCGEEEEGAVRLKRCQQLFFFKWNFINREQTRGCQRGGRWGDMQNK